MVNHDILLGNLEYYKIRGTTLCWLNSYLSERTQTTKIDISYSRYSAVSCGIPKQGALGLQCTSPYITVLAMECTGVTGFIICK